MPKVADLGDEVSAIPALTYELLRPNWSPDTCSLNPAVVDRGDGCPTSDPAFREAVAFAIDKNEINNRLLGGVVQVANTAITPDAWFYADQTPTTRKRPRRSSRRPVGPMRTATASARRMASGRRSSSARPPGRSGSTRWR
jgi:ABC-type transport system substrate-binding protein